MRILRIAQEASLGFFSKDGDAHAIDWSQGLKWADR
jgi:hypothetical protein